MILAAALFHSVVRLSPEVVFGLICFALMIVCLATWEMAQEENQASE